MASNYNVVITEPAKQDIDEIFGYIYNVLCAPNAAERVVVRIYKSISNLELFPRQYPKLGYSDIEYRKLSVENFVVIYRIDDEKGIVYVVRVFDARTNYSI